jgi:hypothetical protein
MNSLPTSAELLRIARERVGLTDLGDSRFATALDQLLDSINRESIVPDELHAATTERWLRLITNRLNIQADLDRRPEILSESLEPPLIICGLPRVGSTKLHQLLAKSGDFQALLFCQGFNPARAARENSRDDERRIEEAARFLNWRSARNPLADAAHYLAAREPEEDTYLLEFTLHTYWPTTYFEVPSFLRWLAGQDRSHAYEYLKQLLQYLQWQFHPPSARRPWLLKSPLNLGFEREMATHLTGARFVMLHRNPIEVIPSLVAIVRELRKLYSGTAGDLRKAGAWAIDEYSSAMARHLAWRRSLTPGTVLDIPYTDVRDDYVSVLSRVYDFLGMTLTAAALERMATWAGDNEQHKHGIHQYSLQESGLTVALIRERFADYIDEFADFLDMRTV